MEAEKTRSIRLPETVWDALDADAARCRRSSQKQIEALLVTFYEIEDVEINKQSLEILGEIMPRGGKGIKVLGTTAHVGGKKKAG
jgi:hypothetical protein